MKINIINIVVSIRENQMEKISEIIQEMGIEKSNINEILFLKRSIDSRKRSDIKFVYNIEVELKEKIKEEIFQNNNIKISVEEEKEIKVPTFDLNEKIIIIGAGPSGLFVAYELCKYGYSPIIIEQGEKIEDRDITIQKFVTENIFNPESNIQYGEGGAGTYSDGKLNTRIKSGYISEVFDTLVKCGAQKEIMWDYKPHIGTDILKIVIQNLRKKIEEMGGKFLFNSKMIDVSIKNSRIDSIEIKNKNGRIEKMVVDRLILAPGHSSRETYYMLDKKGVSMENKPFAVGVRIEHSGMFINKIIYGEEKNNSLLGAATYSLTYNNKEENRGVFSFCMCPGGVVVNASSENGGTLVNGMSYSKRDGKFSNSAVVVAIKANEFGEELFSGMKFQEKIEKKAYDMANGCGAIYQNTEDFLNGKISEKIIETSYEMKLVSKDFNELYPEMISGNIKKALEQWNRNYKGFVSKDASLIGPETRTSSPIRIIRGLNGESVNVKGLYLVGEGSGYAGGITSSAVDGIKVVQSSFLKEKN